jgi:hypothetical protein
VPLPPESPTDALCDGIDNDCDGSVDEDFQPVTCVGACVSGARCEGGTEICGPKAEESDITCDGIDGDCDREVDEDYIPYTCGTGVCENQSTCTAGVETCNPRPPRSTEDPTCDARDDDCDGFVDEDYISYSCGVGHCRNSSICDNGSESCTPAPPLATQDLICDGVDEDCDGNTDEDYVPYSCGRGACLAQSTCVAGFEDCTPGSPPAVSDSVCDGIDEDCDGNVDEDYIPYICGLGDCQRNSQCVGSVQSCTPGPQTGNDQNCDGHDNDCDGSTDEGYTPYTCGTGPCSAQSTCIAGVENCTPGSGTPEVCNGIDDDCDGNCDEGWTCCAGTSVGCATSCGTTGTETCSSTCTSGPCTPPAETCNGMDDDCNGICDEPGCCRGATESCTTSCGSTGTHTCDSTCQWGSCIPPTEICNGVDDDCDGSTDEDYVPWICGMGACIRQSTCTGGVENCTPGTPETEICFNGADDDCDGFEDEDCTIPCPSPQVCPGATDALSPNPVGNRFLDATSDAFNYSGSCGGSQAPDAVYSFTVASLADAFITTHGSFFDTVLYVRACTCDGTELACSDDADGLTTSAIHLRNLPAGTYNIFVDGKTSLSYGNFQMDVYVTAAGLEGDRCGDPVLLTSAGYTYSDPNSTCLMSSDYEPATSGSGAGDCGRYVGTGKAEEMVFYMWVPSDGTVVTLSTCSSASLPSFNTDTALYVRTVCIDGGESCQLGCSDDNRCASGTSDDHLSHLPLTLDRGLYYVISDGYYQADPLIHTCGEFSLSVTGLP